MNPQKKVLLVLTGGTLVMDAQKGGPLAPDQFSQELAVALPEIRQIAHVDTLPLMARDSSNLRTSDWHAIAEAVRKHYLAYDGFVIVHGTDTMAFTASALSFLLPSSSKPIVFTGSQRPIREPRSDARINLVDSLTVATMHLPEIAVSMHSVLLRGNRCRKRSTSAYDAFESPNFPPLAHLGVSIELSPEILQPRGVPGLPLPRPLPTEEKVSILFFTPATRVEEIRIHRELGTKGLLVLAFGCGNLPILERAHVDALGALGIPIVVLTQCFHGNVDLSLYEGGRALLEIGAIDGGDMTPEAALAKLMTGLGVGLEAVSLREYMLSSVAGERRSGI